MAKEREKIQETSIQATNFFRTKWKALLLLVGLFATAAMLSSKDNDYENSDDNIDNSYKDEESDLIYTDRWLRKATDDELDSEREKVRVTNVSGKEATIRYNTLHRFDTEQIKRMNSKYE